MDHWRSIASFLRSAQTGSFTNAGRELGMTPQAVSNQVKMLERWIGVRLFNRTTRQIGLTEEGASFYAHCKTGVGAIETGIRELREMTEEAAGTVRLAVPHGLCQGLIVDLLVDFFETHPRLNIDLVVQNEMPDPVRQGIDVGIIGGTLPSNSLVARRITTVQTILCASPEYLDRNGTPKTLDDLRSHRCVTLRNPRTGKILPWEFQQGDEAMTLDVAGALITNDTETQRRAVLKGAGIGQLAGFFVAPQLKDGKLTRLLTDYISYSLELYIYTPGGRNVPKRTRVLVDFLYNRLSRHSDFDKVASR